ncbi:TetR/AcrR family transcriptional regulator [Pseudoalteromonas denitrificans]|uniref:Transcriptional regulator, TetR family n=1 Tax=Pseudoalteromonas denitrificans DSM 6059 TaxID=1123010 RepID=A0A1I1S0K7_9GAMM|nr:TetR/AcrR family transcriptional regulator [Pseudoalteromonas denitrificans]SFD39842.1 transcriptional regulator, TetR family [Pseudoalteromonas denitrificans DSM 6059]
MNKAKKTRKQILEVALQMATATSLNDLTIGSLAVATDMSKSGLFSHFKSKENLQLAVLDHAYDLFRQIVTIPVYEIESPLERLNTLCDNWLDWYELQAKTCIFISASVEFDDQPGVVHDKIAQDLAKWLSFLISTVQAAIDEKEFIANADAEQFVYELYSLYLGSQSMIWVGLEDANHNRFKLALESLISRYRRI